MSNENNLLGMLNKKKKTNTMSKSVKATQPVKATTTSTAKVKAKKVKPVKVQAQQTQHVPKYNPADIKLETNADASGIHILVLYQGNSVHQLLLLKSHYVLWDRAIAQQKYDFIKNQITPSTFRHDANLIHQITVAVCSILNSLFAGAHRMQAQAQRGV